MANKIIKALTITGILVFFGSCAKAERNDTAERNLEMILVSQFKIEFSDGAIRLRQEPGILQSEPLEMQRNPVVTDKHIVITAEDSSGNEIYRQVMLDPRWISIHEYPEVNHPGRRTDAMSEDVELSVPIPYDKRIRNVNLKKMKGGELEVEASAQFSPDLE
jgi:hypothetical protein